MAVDEQPRHSDHAYGTDMSKIPRDAAHDPNA
jgi:hypothetical protein